MKYFLLLNWFLLSNLTLAAENDLGDPTPTAAQTDQNTAETTLAQPENNVPFVGTNNPDPTESNATPPSTPLTNDVVGNDLVKQVEIKSEPIIIDLPAAPKANIEETPRPWFRSLGEWVSYRTVRPGLSSDPTTKILTDGARYDLTVGKRIPIFSIEKSKTKGFVFGGDGGMFASLRRIKGAGTGVFATESFDGFFGLFAAYTWSSWIAMFRWGHLSAHLVDNAPNFASPINYSHFWGEWIIGKTWPNIEKPSKWLIHAQSSVGMNYKSAPPESNPRVSLGIDGGFSPWSPDALAFLISADLVDSGVEGQSKNYSYFAGMGFLGRPQSTHRPLRFGVTRLAGSDHRNQYYANKQKFLALDISLEL